VIVVPSIRLTDPASAFDRSVRELIAEWGWDGFRRVSVDLPGTLPPADAMRLLETLLAELASHVELQVTGPLESRDDIDLLLEGGACLVRLGDRALDEAEWLSAAASAFPGALVVATPARERRYRARGFTRTAAVDLRDLAHDLSDLPLGGLQVNFLDDAIFDHSDLALVEDLADAAPWPIMVGAATPTLAQLRDLEQRGAAATIVDGRRMVEQLDHHTLARTFSE
jgi:phosphoribosylformimino-5-aminoimidazole carboxamide ribonucleotide (ProFAR) isomerase